MKDLMDAFRDPDLMRSVINSAAQLVALVTKGSHPHLFEAFDSISHDSGGCCHDNYRVPARHLARLAEAEAALATLSKDDLETFCIGEQSEMETIRQRSPELGRTHDLLCAFFDGWIDERPETQEAPSS